MKITKKELHAIIENYLSEQEGEEETVVEDRPADNFKFSVLIDQLKYQVTANRKNEKLSIKVTSSITGDELQIQPEHVGSLFYAALKNMKETDDNYKNILFALKNDIIDDNRAKEMNDKEFVKWLQGRSRHFLIWLEKFKEKFKKLKSRTQ